MSNVLIGIIGVILFIGLALAGALILGDDFRSANSDSKAAALVQQLQQASQAASMYRLRTGTVLPSGYVATSALMGRFLRTQPVGPTPTSGPAYLYDSIGQVNGASPAVYVAMKLKDGASDQQICESIQRAGGQVAPTAAFDATERDPSEVSGMSATLGCIVLNPGRYLAYAKF